MSLFDKIIANLPDVEGPTERKLSFNKKLKWSLTMLCAYFLLGMVPLFGLGNNALQQFEYLSVILGAEFGSLVSLGIGPLVTGSIVLQLLNGSGMINLDTSTHEGKARYQGIQKLLGLFFIVFEAIVYVFMGGLSPSAEYIGTALYFQLEVLLILQIILGGILIMFMDDVINKWGFGSGISLFIAAGVSKSLFIRAFSPLPSPQNPDVATGAFFSFFQFISVGDPINAALMASGIIFTIVVFLVAVYAQSMKVEVPLSFGRVRGYGVRWPLNFIYTSNIPVILVSALFANIQLWARLFQNWGYPIFGTFQGNTPVSGLVSWIYSPSLVPALIKGSLGLAQIGQSLIYMLLMIAGCVVFSIFWVQTSGSDAKSVSKQIMNSGLQIPGFRKDQRVVERLLNRYISPLTVMGAIAVGILAALADLTGALTSGTGLLLTVMILYRLYEEIAKEHMMDLNPSMRKMIK